MIELNSELKTDRGVATFLGDFGKFSAFVHVTNPPAVSDITEINSFETELDILISFAEAKETFLGSVALNHIVDCAVAEGFETEDGLVSLSKDECTEIDESSWKVLSNKYRLVPTRFTMPKY